MNLKKHKPYSAFSVDDVEAAKEFYGQTLGLDVTQHDDNRLWISAHSGDGVLAYPKGEDHRAANFTVLSLPVDDVEAVVDELSSRGIKFGSFDGDLETDAKGIMRHDGLTIAWFKDPAGNVLSVVDVNALPA
jgi:predicted enzyme related to lactoylglutathione lyase